MEQQLNDTTESIQRLVDHVSDKTEAIAQHRLDDSIWHMFHTFPSDIRQHTIRLAPCAEDDKQHIQVDRLSTIARAHLEHTLLQPKPCKWCQAPVPLYQQHQRPYVHGQQQWRPASVIVVHSLLTLC